LMLNTPYGQLAIPPDISARLLVADATTREQALADISIVITTAIEATFASASNLRKTHKLTMYSQALAHIAIEPALPQPAKK